MREKIQVDRRTRNIILNYIRSYDDYKTYIESEQEKLLSISPQNLNELDMPKCPSTKDTTFEIVNRLADLEKTHKYKVVNAIDEAKNNIGYDIVNSAVQDYLSKALWMSCLDGRNYNYEAFDHTRLCCSRTQFYREKNKFLDEIRWRLGL